MSHTHENLFLGTLPKRLVLCCIDNDVYNGSYAKNPFHAKHNNVNFLAVYVDGTLQTTPAEFRRESIYQKLPQPVHIDWQGITGRRERSDS